MVMTPLEKFVANFMRFEKLLNPASAIFGLNDNEPRRNITRNNTLTDLESDLEVSNEIREIS